MDVLFSLIIAIIKFFALLIGCYFVGGIFAFGLDFLENKFPKLKMWLNREPSIPLSIEEYSERYMAIFAKHGFAPDDELSYFDKSKRGAPLTNITVKDYIARNVKASEQLYEENLFIQSHFKNKYDIINWVKRDMEGRMSEEEYAELYKKCIYENGTPAQMRKYEKQRKHTSPMDFLRSRSLLIIIVFIAILIHVAQYIWG